MSSEIAKALNEDSLLSNAIAQDLPPNTHLESTSTTGSNTYGMLILDLEMYNLLAYKDMLMALIDSATSTINPTLNSNYNSTTLSVTSNSSGPESSATGAEASNPQTEALIAPQGKVAEETVGPKVPIRSSSNAKLQTLGGNSMNEQSVTNPISTSRRGSKGSIRPQSRSGSVGSKKEKGDHLLAGTQAKPGTGDSAVITKKKRGGLLSLLNCCSAPEDANTVELGEQAVPAKKAKVLQQKTGRQSTPLVKPNVNAPEAGAVESKTPEDSIGGPEYSEIKSAAKPTMITRSSKDRVTTEKSPAQNNFTQPVGEAKEAPAPTETRDPQLPPPPIANNAPQDAKDGQSTIPVQAAGNTAPPQLIAADESVAQQGTTINDRTPQQEQQDPDIVMVDAPPVSQAADVPPAATRELAQTQTNLPPPPPRNGQDRATSSSTAVAPNEKQQWLLPPLQPQLKGRKCLVLDLDETLVHSSFKVRKLIILPSSI